MLTAGQQFEGLRIKEILGESSLCNSFVAESPGKEKLFLKVFKDEIFTRENEMAYLRQPREAITLGKVTNQAYLSFYKKVATAEIPQFGKRAFLVRGYVAGKNLAEWRNSLASLSEATIIFRKICLGLSHLHRAELIHGALCPQDIIIGDGTLKITDFGTGTNYLSAALKRADTSPDIGSFLPPWFNDQQKFNHPPTDIYALGAILYFLHTGAPPAGIPDDAIPPARKALTGVYRDVGEFMLDLEQLMEEGGQIIEPVGPTDDEPGKEDENKERKGRDDGKSPERVPKIEIQGADLEPELSGLSYRLEKTLKNKKEHFPLNLNIASESIESLTVNLSVASGAEWIRIEPGEITLGTGQQQFWITLGPLKSSEEKQGKIVIEIPVDGFGSRITREIIVSATFRRPHALSKLKWAAVIPLLILMLFFFSDVKKFGSNYLTQAVDFWNQLRADFDDAENPPPLKEDIDETPQPEKEDISGPQPPDEEDITEPQQPLKEEIAALPSPLAEGIEEPEPPVADNIAEQLDRIETDLLDQGEYIAARKKLVVLQEFQPDNAKHCCPGNNIIISMG